MRITHWDQAADLPGPAWDMLASDGEFALTKAMLAMTQLARPKPSRFLAVEPDGGGPPFAATVAQLVSEGTSESSFVRLDLMLRRIAQDAGQAPVPDGLGAPELLPNLWVGAHQPTAARVLLDRRAGAGEQTTALDLLIGETERQAWEAGARTVCVPYVPEQAELLGRVLADRGYLSFPSTWLTVLDVDWPDFEGYLGTLSGDRRRRILRERREVAEAGFEIEVVPLCPAEVIELELLKGNVDAKYHGEGARQAPSPTSPLALSVDGPVGDPVISRARLAGRTVGFALAYQHGEELHIDQVGFDHDAVGGLPVHFEVMYYRFVEHAARRGLRRIYFGPTAYQAKLRRGCRIEPCRCYVLPRDPEVRRALEQFTATIDPTELTETVLRH